MLLTAAQLVEKTENLLSLPDVYVRVNALLDDPTSHADDLTEVISVDPALSVKLLKMVNSPVYGLRGKVDSISRAISVVGFNELRSLVLATVAVGKFKSIKSELVDMPAFWHHSVYTGIAAQQLARHINMLHSERVFLAGLLHDVGRLVLYSQLPDVVQSLLTRSAQEQRPMFELEQEVLGFTHADVGAELFDRWGLPDGLQMSARWHHSPAAASSHNLEVALVHIANNIAGRVEPGANVNCVSAGIQGSAWELTGLSEAVVDEVLSETDDRFFEVLAVIEPQALMVY